ncbi:Cyclin-like [Sesbania bispinosa]|nr:Cyclin-like [Sesbania bispinosa]
MDGSDVTSLLFCDEDPTLLLHSDEDENINITIHSLNNPCPISEQDEKEQIGNLFRLEVELASSNGCFVHVKNTRLIGIDHILKIRERLALKLHTAYLSITYLDRYLSKRGVHEHKSFPIHLLSVACLSLAAKMEECEPPLLSQYVTEEGLGFVNKQSIEKMELDVFCTLEWKLRVITPFDYLHYLVGLFCPESRPEPLVSKAKEHVMAIVKDVNLMGTRPSIVALAATLMTTFDSALTRETMDHQIGEISSWGNLHNGHVFSCYHLMQEKNKEREKLNTPASTLTAEWSYTSALDISSITSSTTMRRLTFDNKENGQRKMPHQP